MMGQATQLYLPVEIKPPPKLFKWQLRERKQVSSFADIAGDSLPREGQWELLNEINAVCPEGCKVERYRLEYDITFQYVVPSHPTYAGSLVKRIRKFLRTQYPEVAFPDSLWGTIGSIIGEYQNAKIWYDFTDRLDWTDGEFGDSGSCFFSQSGCRTHVREHLENEGVHAIRFYRGEAGNSGIGRALLVPYGDDCVIINSYGLTRLKVARILSLITGLEYRKVVAHNNGDDSGEFWLNDGTGQVLSRDIDQYDESGDDIVDFEFDVSARCNACDCSVDPDESRHIDGELYCDECVYYCEDCEEYTLSELSLVHSEYGHERYVCEDCAGEYILCPCCDERFAQ